MLVSTGNRIAIAFLSLLVLGTACLIRAQDTDDSKAIKAEVFINARPARKIQTTAKYRRTNTSKPTAELDTPPVGSAFAQVGITTWRFRRSTATDKTKELVEEDGEPIEWTLERISDGTALAPGDRVRLSIESLSRDGYLYVINREEYADGSLGDPVLIFPTLRSATNRVEAGRLVYIPSASGRFRIKPSDSVKKHVAEVLSIIVSPKPLISDDQLATKAIRLRSDQIELWKKDWQVAATKFEMDGGVGQAMTTIEQSAASSASQLLTQDDPVPQTVYRVAVKPENPVFVTVSLRFAKTK